MRKAAALLAATLGVIALAAVPSTTRPTVAAWTDDVVLTAPASAAEFFGCQQGPVVVTSLEAPPASTVTVQGIDEECAGEAITVRVFDERIGGELGEIPIVSSFETGDDGWVPMGGSSIERTNVLPRSGAWSLRSFNRTQTFNGPSRDMTGLVVPGETYLASVWVWQATGSPQTFQFTARETMAGGGDQYRAIATATAPSGVWTQLEGQITVDPASVAQLVYIEAPDNAWLEFFIDDVRAETPAVPPPGAWVAASGTVTLPDPTLDTDPEFSPVEGPGAMPVEVEIDGYAVPATWDYEPPPVQEWCAVVFTGTFDPVPGLTCESTTVTVTGGWGDIGSRVRSLGMSFRVTGTERTDPHEIVFTTDLSAVAQIPADWVWSTSGVNAGSFWPVAGYSCADLPSFSARAPGWAAGGPAFIELIEQSGGNFPVCGP